MQKPIKTFTDSQKNKVKIGDLVSVTGWGSEKMTSIYEVKGIERHQRVIEVNLFCNINQLHFYSEAVDLTSEM